MSEDPGVSPALPPEQAKMGSYSESVREALNLLPTDPPELVSRVVRVETTMARLLLNVHFPEDPNLEAATKVRAKQRLKDLGATP